MPSDLMPDEGHLVVHDRAGASLPFSRGIMATSLLATGVTTGEAHRLASVLFETLREEGRSQIEADELVARADRLLADYAGPELAARWLAWRRAKRVGRPIVVSLCGAPGVGKSTIATRLAIRLDITRIVTTDTIREVLRTVIPATVLPELHASSYELIDRSAATPFAGFDRQAGAVAAATNAVVSRLATEQRPTVVEGVHASPGFLSPLVANHPAAPIAIERLIVEHDAATHRQRLAIRSDMEPHRRGERSLDAFNTIRELQAHLIGQAERHGIPVVDVTKLGDLTQDIVDEIVQRTSQAGAANAS